MSLPVQLTAFATWTSGGVCLGGAPLVGEGGALGPWPEAPELSRIHPRARRPLPSAKAIVQLAYALLSEREARGEALPRDRTALSIGTHAGCAAADLDFQNGLTGRGLGFGSPAVFVYTLPTAAPGEVSIALGLKGGLHTVSAGAASGLSAVVSAAAQVAAGRCAACLCGHLEMGPAQSPRPESISLFLLEPGEGPLRLSSWRSGFGEGAPGPATPGDPLHALAVAAASGAASLLTSVSPEGYWVSLEVTSP